MIEMRREKRWPAKLNLEISNLFKQDHVKVENINAPIEVIDVSKAGIGFRSASVLPMGYYFNLRRRLFCTGVFILKKIFTNPIDKGNTRWYL